jgi:hypothetical protein
MPWPWPIIVCLATGFQVAHSQETEYGKQFDPFVWASSAPEDCPFQKSDQLKGIKFTGRYKYYPWADTWYPSWASDGNLYSPWTDGGLNGFKCESFAGDEAQTASAVIMGDSPFSLMRYPTSIHTSSSEPYVGRYPCGSLVYNGVWYYGTYCVDVKPSEEYPYIQTWKGRPCDIYKSKPEKGKYNEGMNINYLRPFVGFRTSTDFGQTWKETPHTPANPIFPDPSSPFTPTKIGSPHFVDFGKNMEHSPDGNAYLIAHGSIDNDPKPKCDNASWITGDAIYLLRVKPSIENMNDASKYEYFSGMDQTHSPVWSHDFKQMKPLLEWNNNCGCVNMTYNAALKRYLMMVSYGETSFTKFNTYVLESEQITGPWKLVTYMKNFGEQAYFVNIPTKFIGKDGKTMWLLYSARHNSGDFNEPYKFNPPGGEYGMTFQEIELIENHK